MGLLDGDLAEAFHGVFSSVYLDATLHRSTITENGAGGGTQSFVDEPVKAQLSRTTQAMRDRAGYVDTDQRILVLAHGIDRINPDCEITVRGVRWSIANVATDPALSYYDLHGRKA